MASANANKITFCFNVITLSLTNDSKWFLYTLVFINQTWNLSDPLAKQNDANNKNGVVGRIGSITPSAPKENATKPMHIYIPFLTLFIF